MPNWCVGELKIRGSKENIINWLTNGIVSVPFTCLIKLENDKPVIESDEWETYVTHADKEAWSFYIKGTRRNFLKEKALTFYHDDKEKQIFVFITELSSAWSINAKDLQSISKQYNIDIKIYAFEKGMEFNQDIEIVNGEIIKDNEITFENYKWECISPSIGG